MKKRLHEIQKLVNEPLIQPALDAVATVELRLGNSQQIIAAADAVGKAAYEVAAQADGNRLVALDPLMPPPSEYKH
jgi:hypothetical protein